VTFTVNTLTNYTYSGNVSLQSPAKVAIPTEVYGYKCLKLPKTKGNSCEG